MSVSDPRPVTATYAYDALDRLTGVTAPNLTAIGMTYDAGGRRLSLTDEAGTTGFAYDGLNRLRSETQHPSWPTTTPTLVTQSTYDLNGNRLTLLDPLGRTTTFGYDALNRLTSLTYSDGVTPTVSYTYDAHGNRTGMTDGVGSTSYTYDEQDRLLSVTSPGPKTVGYRYDRDGNRTKVIYPDSTVVTSTFDKASRLTGLLDWASRATSYGYLPDGALETLTHVNGATTQQRYDNARRLTEIWHQQSGTTIGKHTYTVNAIGNRTQLDEVLAQVGGGSVSQTLTYGYDQLSRLTTATTPNDTTTYTYDPVGNRLSRTRGGTTTSYAYDRADRVTSAGGVSYTVNANGNLTARGGDSFGYDQANRLTSVTVGGTTSGYTYDGDGKRTSKTTGGTTTSFVYDVNAGLPVLLDDGSRKYVWGLGLAYAVDGGGGVDVYHADGLGSVRALTDGTGTVVQTAQTDEFGVSVQAQGNNGQPFGYTGEQQDSETGFVYLRARLYDPAIGRFLQRDPFPGRTMLPLSLNRYSYVENDPVNSVDPTGLDSRIKDASLPCLSLPKSPIDLMFYQEECSDRETESRQISTCHQTLEIVPFRPCISTGISYATKGPSGKVSTEKYLERRWDKGTFETIWKSVLYHIEKACERNVASRVHTEGNESLW